MNDAQIGIKVKVDDAIKSLKQMGQATDKEAKSMRKHLEGAFSSAGGAASKAADDSKERLSAYHQASTAILGDGINDILDIGSAAQFAVAGMGALGPVVGAIGIALAATAIQAAVFGAAIYGVWKFGEGLTNWAIETNDELKGLGTSAELSAGDLAELREVSASFGSVGAAFKTEFLQAISDVAPELQRIADALAPVAIGLADDLADALVWVSPLVAETAEALGYLTQVIIDGTKWYMAWADFFWEAGKALVYALNPLDSVRDAMGSLNSVVQRGSESTSALGESFRALLPDLSALDPVLDASKKALLEFFRLTVEVHLRAADALGLDYIAQESFQKLEDLKTWVYDTLKASEGVHEAAQALRDADAELRDSLAGNDSEAEKKGYDQGKAVARAIARGVKEEIKPIELGMDLREIIAQEEKIRASEIAHEDELIALQKKQDDLDKKMRDEQKRADDQELARAKQLADEEMRAKVSLLGSTLQIVDAMTTYSEGRIADLERELQAQQEAGSAAAAFTAEQLRQEKERARRRAAFAKAIAITEATVQTGVAIAEALPNPILAAAAGVAGAAAVASIAATPLPTYHTGGMVTAGLLPGESVFNRTATANMGRDGVERANRRTGDSRGGGVTNVILRGRVVDQIVEHAIKRGSRTKRALALAKG